MLAGPESGEDLDPGPWFGQPCWTVLDICPRQGARRFLALWRRWQEDPRRPSLLHHVLVAAHGHAFLAALEEVVAEGRNAAMARPLQSAAYGLTPGIHRLVFDEHRVMLTLALGETGAMLRDLQLSADRVHWAVGAAGIASATTRQHLAKSLARLCRHGAKANILASRHDPPQDADWRGVIDAIGPCGFLPDEPAPGGDRKHLRFRFAPHWRPVMTHQPARAGAAAGEALICLVVGAGLAGAAVAAAMARRGWSVLVLDQDRAPAAGASGLPVGLLVPHFSADDNLFSKLTRAGARITWAEAARLIRQHEDWDMAGTLEIVRGPNPAAGKSVPGMSDWLQRASARQLELAGAPPGTNGRWHRQAGWIRPAALVQALLATPGVRFRGASPVARLSWREGRWTVMGRAGEMLASADMAVIAAGPGSDELLPGGLGLRPVSGQVSWAEQEIGEGKGPALPPFPVNGNGSLVAGVPFSGGAAWYLGASYHRDSQSIAAPEDDHRANLARLQALSPDAAAALKPVFDKGEVNAWAGVRATTADRMPMVGAPDPVGMPGLWVSTGMGSRGLTFALLCGELLAAQACGEPWPIGRRLAAAMSPRRLAKQGPGPS